MGGVWAGMLWALTAFVMATAWALLVISEENWIYAGMLAATGATLSTVAGVLHVKTYACRVSALVRICAGIPRPEDTEIRLLP